MLYCADRQQVLPPLRAFDAGPMFRCPPFCGCHRVAAASAWVTRLLPAISKKCRPSKALTWPAPQPARGPAKHPRRSAQTTGLRSAVRTHEPCCQTCWRSAGGCAHVGSPGAGWLASYMSVRWYSLLRPCQRGPLLRESRREHVQRIAKLGLKLGLQSAYLRDCTNMGYKVSRSSRVPATTYHLPALMVSCTAARARGKRTA